MPKQSQTKRSQTKSKPEQQVEQQVDDPIGPVYFWRPKDLHGYLGEWFTSPVTSTEPDGRKIEYQNAEQ